MRPPFYYRLAIRLARPIYRLVLAQKKHRLPHYQREIKERFGKGYLSISHDKPVIWCHAVSLGKLLHLREWAWLTLSFFAPSATKLA